ncbi:MAG TPA: glutamate--tRNA ligase [Spirochaetota bacterium]|nr:glutamate--tRNA ligase [Spirochaetota bacterium]HPF06305.1 glutamate--tRNA ligase [Spirochaetota bacterium]HPJ40902.1 glutamate--tRNA ligase [Spirochaetota bacterium]HPR37749.1 glutamate--tRNA ligase [Spirochaetota bacterium]HRX47762.1 glutamate--tRNA ligase [Spirochaetota bacterium]
MRVRFAPSPTGYLHIGNARTAVINYLIAKKTSAEYIIRIEDTDRERSTKESEISILNDLKWLGINWTEGPDIDKGHGPYRQSERDEIYREYTEKLIKSGNAFRCFCTREQVEEDKNKAMAENKPFLDRCREKSLEEQDKLASEGKEFTVKFKVPENEVITFDDKIKGTVTFNSSNIGGDFIIVRSDGGPVYNYIVSIDDALMEVTHVIRGEDHLSNTPKQMLIAKALGLPQIEYAHLPLILGFDKKKLSKRHGITSVDIYKQEGYLPEALMNYLGLLGWSTESGEELLEFDKLVELFDITHIGKSPAVFDFQKLKWMNGNYMKKYPVEQLTDMLTPYIDDAGFSTSAIERSRLEGIVSILRNSCEILSDIKNLIGIFLNDINEPDEDTDAHLKEDYALDIIRIAADVINEVNETTYTADFIAKIKEKSPHKGKKLFHPIRAMVTGRLSGPDLDLAMPYIGYANLKKRVEYANKRYC